MNDWIPITTSMAITEFSTSASSKFFEPNQKFENQLLNNIPNIESPSKKNKK